ncbi:MAG: pyruvate carboxyltransferase [Desulfobacula sp.]|jgi:hydroxymethylglutaryl-CoA lyase|uniref:pyruvate carboxyltransferase n=1 Tax=Desulfobacula sp. TaxID=2593537 RepID=UPI001D896C0F|nr:pyruvate carboxyltransferase [Desulfobacula sp.]MBT3484606.1 pyruvate carboxyltransferase [Desulfobacula sp.]MBT3803976.1 pyruvate carboxyltransferase [Desulfobacula sp.]MBT4023591.1 pyruvate carboxyltransferase [Desulfobacula sp.]MBT4197741.1 pyruvate carboxyltransferase [Desulfobacula sp.]
MTEYDYWKIFPKMPKKVTIGDITVRDGFQHLEKFISTQAKITYLEELIFAGCRNIEVTNLGNPRSMPQFSDAEDLLAHLRGDNFVSRAAKKGINMDDVVLTAITIREPSVDRAIELKRRGVGPDRVLMMVSTEEQHHFANSGTTLPNYWAEAERCIKKCSNAGIKMCGTVSTIWGSPIGGATQLKDAVAFTKYWLSIGASDIEHADHDGSASAADVYRYFSMILDEMPDTSLHIAHFHETKRVASASVLAALQAGICHFEATLGGLGGQPANFLDDRPIKGTGDYYYDDERYVGLVCLEDTLVQIDEMGIEHGYDVDRILWLGKQLERTVGKRLRSEAMINGRTLKEGHMHYARPGLAKLKEKLGESPDQNFPK